MELKIGLNNMHSKNGGVHVNCNYQCVGVCYPIGGEARECCAYQVTIPRLITLWNSILCPKLEGHNWHKCAYLTGECNLCGTKP
jgi:hypothetical protein